MQYPTAAVAEPRRSVTELGFVGALVNDHTNGRYLDAPEYDDLWSALDELGFPLYIHPGSLPVDDWHVYGRAPGVVPPELELAGRDRGILYSNDYPMMSLKNTTEFS